ncbi:MAG TPA: hypothetical protein V6D17_11550, partial [Candidatus Obscuribacterales bacterium]
SQRFHSRYVRYIQGDCGRTTGVGHQNMYVALFTECLKALTKQLSEKQILVSDAILSSLKILRIVYDGERLTPLNRELLGYLDEEVKEFERLWREADHLSIAQLGRQGVPTYRMINGFWVEQTGSSRLRKTPSYSGSRGTIFANFGAVELELLLARFKGDEGSYVGIKFENDGNSVFMCRSSQLFSVYSAIRENVRTQIEQLTKQMSP